MAQRLKDITPKDLVDNTVEIEMAVKDLRLGTMKNGGKFLTLVGQDGRKTLELVKFGVHPDIKEEFSIGRPYIFTVTIKPYASGINGISCMIECWTESPTPPTDFIAYEEGYDKAYKIVWDSLMSINSTIVGQIAYKSLEGVWDKFKALPAAVSMHHFYPGGLIVHTSGVLTTALAIADLYSTWYKDARINRNLLIAGALLHDVGKCEEYDLSEGGLAAVYAGAGVLAPHIISGMSLVSIEAYKLGYGKTQQLNELLHLIASHHGRSDWGSPVEPHTIEADILSYSDMIDATISRRITLNNELPVGEGVSKRLGSQNFATYVSVPEV